MSESHVEKGVMLLLCMHVCCVHACVCVCEGVYALQYVCISLHFCSEQDVATVPSSVS